MDESLLSTGVLNMEQKMADGTGEQKIRVLDGGPCRVEGGVPIFDHEGGEIEAPPA